MKILQRFGEDYLFNWIKSSYRKPLIIRGARQVGKSTLIRQFTKNNSIVLNEINLEKHLYLNDIFKTLDLKTIISELEALIGNNIQKPGSLLFLDEIQATPYAIQALRYFYEEMPEIPIASAGSLLEFTLADHSFSMPVGRIEYYYLGPMTFKEFILALAPDLYKYFSEIGLTDTIPLTAHSRLLKKQREYLFVGGMPEAVSRYKETNSFEDIRKVHRSITDTYLDDFSKYARHKELLLLQKVFNSIPGSIGHKVKYSNISRDDRSKDVKNAITLLSKARICSRIFHSHCRGVPLHSDINDSVYKLIFLDVGLVNNICGTDWLSISNLDERELVNEGSLAEQFIGQHLLDHETTYGSGHLNYWLREGKVGNAEVDYVITSGNRIFPIEVKSGTSGSLKSLQQFVFIKKAKLAIRFDLNTPSIQEVEHSLSSDKGVENARFRLLSLPLYAVEELPRIINKVISAVP